MDELCSDVKLNEFIWLVPARCLPPLPSIRPKITSIKYDVVIGGRTK